jgi:hypothetical protein
MLEDLWIAESKSGKVEFVGSNSNRVFLLVDLELNKSFLLLIFLSLKNFMQFFFYINSKLSSFQEFKASIFSKQFLFLNGLAFPSFEVYHDSISIFSFRTQVI